MSENRRRILTNWAKTLGIDTSLFEDEAEWGLLEAMAEMHVSQRETINVA